MEHPVIFCILPQEAFQPSLLIEEHGILAADDGKVSLKGLHITARRRIVDDGSLPDIVARFPCWLLRQRC